MNARHKGKWQGMNWIRQEKRLALYLRDGLACVWCGDSVENGAELTLDHFKPHSRGGTNDEGNLGTCCRRCNTSRGTRGLKVFATVVANYVNHGVTPEDILAHIKRTRSRSLKPFLKQAKDLIASRGSAARVLEKLAA